METRTTSRRELAVKIVELAVFGLVHQVSTDFSTPRFTRLQRRTKAELLRVIHEEFKGISMYEVRARIAEIPWRYCQLVETGGRRIKSDLW